MKIRKAMKIPGSFILFIGLVWCVACSDDEDRSIRFYNSWGQDEIEKFNGIIGENWIRVKGGSGVYSVRSGSEEVLAASISGDIITLRAYKEGNVEVTVTDNDNLLAVIPVTVEPRKRIAEIKAVHVEVRAEDALVKKSIEDELVSGFQVSAGGSYDFEYKTWNNGVYAGTLVIHPKSTGDAGIRGTFTWDGTVRPNIITMKYNDLEIVLEYPFLPDLPRARDAGPSSVWVGENFTGNYKEKYPDAGITCAARMQQLSLFR